MMAKSKAIISLSLLAAIMGGASTVANDMARVRMADAKGTEVGELELWQTPHGVLVTGRLSGLPPGPHAFHIHEVGKCEPPFESAGGHFNPTRAAHGYLTGRGMHAGDLPNLHVPESGKLEFDMLATRVTLAASPANSLFDADGSAFIIHAAADDYRSDPAGEAGERIACGTVGR
jgi:Cu-Zn family superoxide dismutase